MRISDRASGSLAPAVVVVTLMAAVSWAVGPAATSMATGRPKNMAMPEEDGTAPAGPTWVRRFAC